jgi:hypothetical protein
VGAFGASHGESHEAGGGHGYPPSTGGAHGNTHVVEEPHGDPTASPEGGEPHRFLSGGGEGGHESGCICEDMPLHSIEMIETAAIGLFTLDYLVRLLTVHAVPYK